MSAWNFMWDAVQEERITRQEEKIAKLEKRVKELENQLEMAARWINYLKEQGNVTDARRTQTDT